MSEPERSVTCRILWSGEETISLSDMTEITETEAPRPTQQPGVTLKVHMTYLLSLMSG